MADIELIAPAVPKNNGTFPIMYGKDIDIDGKRLPELLDGLGGDLLHGADEEDILALFGVSRMTGGMNYPYNYPYDYSEVTNG